MSLIVQELCGSIKALNVVAKKIIQHQSKSCKVILSSKWKIDLGQYEQTTKFAKRQYSDIPSNGTCSMPNHYCLICGKSFFDSKALNPYLAGVKSAQPTPCCCIAAHLWPHTSYFAVSCEVFMLFVRSRKPI